MIIIAPYARPLRNEKLHPKDYPWWNEVIYFLKKDFSDQKIIQVGVENEIQLVSDFRKNLSLTALSKLVDTCDTWISVDSFFQHFAWDRNKRGVVIFGQSDPNIFGHPENINLLKDRVYLRENQFLFWENVQFSTDPFVTPLEVINAVNQIFKEKNDFLS